MEEYLRSRGPYRRTKDGVLSDVAERDLGSDDITHNGPRSISCAICKFCFYVKVDLLQGLSTIRNSMVVTFC